MIYPLDLLKKHCNIGIVSVAYRQKLHREYAEYLRTMEELKMAKKKAAKKKTAKKKTAKKKAKK